MVIVYFRITVPRSARNRCQLSVSGKCYLSMPGSVKVRRPVGTIAQETIYDGHSQVDPFVPCVASCMGCRLQVLRVIDALCTVTLVLWSPFQAF